MNKIIVIFLCSLSILTSNAQKNIYIINGTIKNISFGKLYLVANESETKYYGLNHTIDSTDIRDGKFEIRREIFDNQPYAYRFIIKRDSKYESTDLVFITPHNQTVTIDSINAHISPSISGSKVQYEMEYEYNTFFKPFVDELNSFYKYNDEVYSHSANKISNEKTAELELMIKQMSRKGDSLFLQYSLNHLNSYVTLWKLIERFTNSGYTDDYYKIYNLLSNDIKDSYTGKIFLQYLDTARLLAIGNIFPILKLKTLDQKLTLFDANKIKGTYTLIDFWFSSCAPCRRQFPLYLRLYNEYKIMGFNII
jgi:hypothetical protein